MLCGFLAPDGTYTECEPFAHMNTAFEMCEKLYNQEFYSGIQAEDYLYDKGYVFFYRRNAQYRFFANNTDEDGREINLMTEVQVDFIINHLETANNDEQKKDMLMILQYNDDFKEDSILAKKDNEKERLFLK